jgi:hypothetical protein
LITVGGDTLTGLAEAFSSKNVLGTYESTLVVTGYTVNDGDDGLDYTVTTMPAAGTITPAPLTITAATDTKVYDGTTSATAIPTFTGLIIVGGDTLTGLAEAFSSKNVLGSGGSTLVVTSYKVNDGDGADDYTVITQTAGGTITPAPLTISANNQTMTAGGAVPPLTASYLGLVKGDTPASLTTPAVLATSASGASAAGDYSITVSGASSPDYAITYRAGTITVSPAVSHTTGPAATSVTLTASESSAVYGQSVTLTAAVSTAAGTPSGTVAFYDGTTLLASVPIAASGTATLTSTTLSTGSHAIVANYNGNTDFAGSQSAPSSITVAPATTQVVALQNPVFKKRKLTSFKLTAKITPSAPGGGVPGGEVTFELLKKSKKKVKVITLGSAVVSGGAATLTLKASEVKGNAITIVYSGDADDKGSTVTTAKIS